MHWKSLWICAVSVACAFFATRGAHADPIKLKPIAVTASSTYTGTSPSNAADGNINTVWNAGLAPNGQPFPWIKIDLGHTVALRKIRFLPAQTPNGNTSHTISVGQSEFNLTAVGTINGYTSDNQWFEWQCTSTQCGNARYIQISTGLDPSWVAWREIEVYQGVEYFGYFADAVDQDRVAQTTGNGANLVMIGGDMTPWATEVAEATNRGAKVVISASAQFFDGSFKLRSDWSTQWSNILQFIIASPKGSIAAIYPLDEPYNNGWNGGDTSAMINALRTLANQIHADTKAQLGASLPVAVIQRITEVGCSAAVCPIDMFDWVGFDCYGPWNNCQGTNLHDVATQLRAKLSSSQRMIAVPWAFLYQPVGNAPATQYGDIDVINHWQREIMADPSYVAVVPFLWQSGYIDGPSNPPAYGTVDLPLIKERLYQFAHTVLHPDSTIYPLDYAASSSTADSLPFYAFDRITSNGWNSGTFPQAWVLADFGGSTRVKQISVTYGQYPAGQTTNIIEGCPNQYYCSNNMWSQLVNYQGYTQDGSTLSWPINTDATQIRVRTTQSPSWVAWKEISFSQ